MHGMCFGSSQTVNTRPQWDSDCPISQGREVQFNLSIQVVIYPILVDFVVIYPINISCLTQYQAYCTFCEGKGKIAFIYCNHKICKD